MEAARILVSGTVQGVSFRSFTKSNAERLGIRGYVKNLENGDVEIIAEGDGDKINELIRAVRSGPEGSDVKNIDVKHAGKKGYKDFSVMY